jgi:membrane fusion protein, multidrug efflux system
VTVELPNAQERLRAGQYAVAQVRLNDETPRLTVPVSALVSTGGEQQVWLLEQDKLVRRTVVLGRRDERNGRVEILQGLTAQNQVLVARFENLRDGAAAKKVASVLPGVQPSVGAAGVATAVPAASSATN